VKVAIDQFIQAPALLALIISGMSIMQGKGIDGMKLDMRHEYVSTLIKNCELRMLWGVMPCQAYFLLSHFS
jgi:hypothetical protein